MMATLDLRVLALGLAAIVALSLATWVVSLFKRDVSVVDSMWSLFLLAGGVVYAALAPQMNTRGWIVLVLLALWSLRLAVHLTMRNWGEPEDRRYRAIRANHEPGFALKSVYVVFLLQAVLAWVVSASLHAAILGSAALGILDVLGAALVAFGILFESIADAQLGAFVRSPESRGRVMDRGLWRFSRHPNYFGECCVWWGFWLFAIAAGGWWSLVSPLLITVLLLRISGVTLLERDIGERRPQYSEYVARTSPFLPLPPRQ